ncbi:MAG: hypothetical protein JOY54_04210 [Acidobacteriaceae bacterium]|nr:hypothetical protein [Acidobacteriaceae bacterium]
MDRRQAVSTLAAAPFAAVKREAVKDAGGAGWKQVLAERLPLYGHRNWIVVADSAYPAQSRSGIETVVSDADHLEVLHNVLAALSASRHVRPIVYQDKELKFVPEHEAPGVDDYRRQLGALFKNDSVHVLPHEEIIAKLDQAGQTFEIFIIKTNLTIPYTSVFLQLDCAYWSADAEQRLRATMGNS